MTDTVNPELPVDLRGNLVSLDDIKAMICVDVAELAIAYGLMASDEARRSDSGTFIPNRRILNLVGMWEAAHDRHWAWYRARLDDAVPEGSGL